MKLSPLIINNKKYTFRKGKKSDEDFFIRLAKETMFPLFRRTGGNPSVKRERELYPEVIPNLYILMVGSRRIGILVLCDKGSYYFIEEFMISPSYQNKGIGSAILDYVETLGKKRIELYCRLQNRAYNLYKRKGYKVRKRNNIRYFMYKELQ